MRWTSPLFVPFLLAAPLAAQTPLRIGLDTSGLEWLVSLEGGGLVCSRVGKPLLKLAPGEKVRIWWDSRGEGDPAEEYRIQVGPPLPLKEAESLMATLKALGEAPDRFRVADGDTWRILTGHFARPAEADPILVKLAALGHAELWVASEKRPGKPRKGRALYAVTDRYERIPLPIDGIRFHPVGETTRLHGKGSYRGTVTIHPNAQGRLTVMNTVALESYLRGVVPREMGPNEFPSLEALKAQAVAARTYAYVNRGKREKEGFDLLDTVADQVYGGVEGESSLTDRAVAETAGLIATYGGKPIQALFMANCGGATVDNRHVFGNGHPYLQGVSNYAAAPLCLGFKGQDPSPGGSVGLSWDLLKLVAHGIIPTAWLGGEALAQPLRTADLREPMERILDRLDRRGMREAEGEGPETLLWIARCLGLDQLQAGMERPQDADYFLGSGGPEGERLLAAFLARRSLVPASWWQETRLTRLQGLTFLAKAWQELETVEVSEGTLLRDGLVRRKGQDPAALPVVAEPVLVEEAPGGALRWVKESRVQVGDRLRWIPAERGSRILVRRLDPDGASLDRYNPAAHWKVEVREDDLLARLQDRVGFKSVGHLSVTWNDQGRALELRVTDGGGRIRTFTGMRIRGILGLKDNVFRFLEVGRTPERRWLFYGRGYGHGVGMDQTGAYGLALEGATFDQILKHYYQGIALTKIGD